MANHDHVTSYSSLIRHNSAKQNRHFKTSLARLASLHAHRAAPSAVVIHFTHKHTHCLYFILTTQSSDLVSCVVSTHVTSLSYSSYAVILNVKLQKTFKNKIVELYNWIWFFYQDLGKNDSHLVKIISKLTEIFEAIEAYSN